MFEKEAEEYAIENWEYYEEGKNDSKALKQAYQRGAEFGYNKANEWHYPSKGEYPKDEKNFESYVVAYYGAKGSPADGRPCWEELCYDTEYKRWVDKETLDDIPYVNQEGIVIAWKEIVLSKEIKANDDGDIIGHDMCEAKAKALAAEMQEKEPDADWEAMNGEDE